MSIQNYKTVNNVSFLTTRRRVYEQILLRKVVSYILYDLSVVLGWFACLSLLEKRKHNE